MFTAEQLGFFFIVILCVFAGHGDCIALQVLSSLENGLGSEAVLRKQLQIHFEE